MGIGHRRAHIVGLTGAEQLNILLTHNVSARHGQPATHRLASGHHVGFHRNGVAYAKVLRVAQSASHPVGLLHDGTGVVGTHLLVAIASWGVALRLQRSTAFVNAKQVWRCIMKVAFLAINNTALQFARLLPCIHLLVGNIGYIFTYIRLHLIASFREVVEQAMVQVGLPRILLISGLHDIRPLRHGRSGRR